MFPSHHSHAPSLPPYLTPPRGGPHKALFMPDILQSILAYAVQPSVDDLRHKDLSRIFPVRNSMPAWLIYGRQGSIPAWAHTQLVCRCWYHNTQAVVFRCVTSKPDRLFFSYPIWSPHPLLQVQGLQVVGSVRDNGKAAYDHVDLLLAQLDHLLSKSNSPAGSQLRELSIADLCPPVYLRRIFDITPLRAQLTLLEIVADEPLGLDLLFPSEDAPGRSSTPLPNLRHLLLQGIHFLPLPQGYVRNSKICLVTLRLDQVIIPTDALHTLLLCVAGPALKQLALSFQSHFLETHLTPTFLATWAPLCSGLDWFEVSGPKSQRNTLTLHSLRGRVPPIQWFGWINIPNTNTARFTLDFQMSVLDISGDRIYDESISSVIHQFLCSKDAIFLREVIVPTVPYNIAIFDPAWIHADKVSPQPWTCTALQKLVVSFSLPQYTDDKWAPWVAHCSPAQYSKASRLACGFIVASCPELVTLDVTFNDKAFDLDTEGGLCFLGRLQRLEHLVLRHTNGLTQSFPVAYLDSSRRNPWPYNKHNHRVLVQKQKAFIPWFTGSGTTKMKLSLPVLRWMSTEPTADDRLRGWTNLARCRHLYRLDNDALQTGTSTGQEQGKKIKAGLNWQSILEAILTSSEAGEGACWDRLESFVFHVEPYDCGQSPPMHKEKGAFCDAFIHCYSEELRKVLPHVDIKFCIKQ